MDKSQRKNYTGKDKGVLNIKHNKIKPKYKEKLQRQRWGANA